MEGDSGQERQRMLLEQVGLIIAKKRIFNYLEFWISLLFFKNLPESLSLLAGRSGAIEKVILSFETSYQAAESDRQKIEIEKRAYHYVADCLSTIVKDIETVGGKWCEMCKISLLIQLT